MLIQIPAGDRVLNIKEVARRVGLAQSTLEQHIRAGKFPQPLKLTAGKRPRIGWLASSIEAHLARLAAQAQHATAERASDTLAAPAVPGHLEMHFPAVDRAAVAVRRLARFGFRAEAFARGEQHVVEIALERSDVRHTLDMLKCCVGDVVRLHPPVFVEAGQPGAAQ